VENFRTLNLPTAYSLADAEAAFSILNRAGIATEFNDGAVALKFDAVNMKYLHAQKTSGNQLLTTVVDELLKIRSFSTGGGKTIFKSFNKEKKVIGKTANRKKRLGYEAFKRDFSPTDNEFPPNLLNRLLLYFMEI
jgi:hypothetical protein